IISDISRCSMRPQRGPAYGGHLEHAVAHPYPRDIKRVPGTLIVWALLLEGGQDTLGAIARPDHQDLLVRRRDEVRDLLIQRALYHLRLRHFGFSKNDSRRKRSYSEGFPCANGFNVDSSQDNAPRALLSRRH